MGWALNNFSIALFISALTAAVVAFAAYQRRKVYGATTMMWILLALTFWSTAYGIENMNPSLQWHKFWTWIQFTSIPLVPTLWLLFAIQYTQQNKTPHLLKLAPLFIVPVISVFMAWTNDFHSLFWSRMTMTELSGVSLLDVEFGPFFKFYAFYSYAAIFAGIFLFLRHALKSGYTYRSQAAIMLAAVIIFITGNGLYLLNLLPFRGLDITPFSFTISSIILSYGLFRHHLLDLMPIANEMILQNIGDGVLVLDQEKRIVFINPAFEKMAGLLPETSVGVPVSEVLFNWPDIFSKPQDNHQIETKITLGDEDYYLQIEVSPIWHRDTLQGSIFVIHDITERATSEEKLRLFLQGREKVTEEYIFMLLDSTNSKILEVNGAFTVCSGYSPEDVIGKTAIFLNLISVETRTGINRKLRKSPVLEETIINIRASHHREQRWKTSISRITLNKNTVNLWVAQPIIDKDLP